MRSWIEVSGERLAGNFRVVAEAAGAETDVLAVVKANAYGHGADCCAVTLAQAGAKWLGVGTASEGALVRQALEEAGFGGDDAPRILVMCGLLPEDVAAIVQNAMTPVVWTMEQVGWLARTGVPVHVEVETGMGRQGIRPGGALDALLNAMGAAGIALDGVLTHFCAAEVAESEPTREQQQRFSQAITQVRERGLKPAWVHAGSSSSIDNSASEDGGSAWLVQLAKTVDARAMVRCGIALYGYCLPIECIGMAQPRIREKLQPVMTWKTHVLDVRKVEAGESVGYNATFVAEAPMRLALLPVGYSDGLRRELSSTNAKPGGWAMVRGRDGVAHRAAIVGRISMNLTVIDVTGVDGSVIDGVRVGDEVVLLGDGVTADDHARLAGTISYDILCGIRAG
jgi:alanine racemase